MAPPTSTHTLGSRCLELDRAVISLDGRLIALPRPLEPVRHPYGPAVGIRCAPTTAAIAYPIAARLMHDDPIRRRLAMVVHRDGSAHVVDPEGGAPMAVSHEFGPVIDVGRRALGLSTPPEPIPPVVMLDAIWIDRALAATLDADMGSPPPWEILVVLHPLAGVSLTPWMLRDRRLSLALDWSAFRHRATGAESPWPDLPPSLAEWLDDGSFARWVLADLASTRLLLDDLAELVEPQVMADIDEALAGQAQW
jgi:hypothetical protein